MSAQMTQTVVEAATGEDAAAALIAAADDADAARNGEVADTDDQPDETDDAGDSDDDGADKLGDKGQQALRRMKDKLREERRKRIAAEQAAAAKADGDEADRIRREAEQAATEKANTRIVKAEIRAAAAGKLADPADALTFIDPSDFEVDDDGEVDQEEIADAVADLIRRKPYLAAQGGPKVPKPDRSQGATGNGTATAAQQFAALANQYI